MTTRHSERGFALLDALVALGIVAVVTALFFQIVSSTALTARGLDERRDAYSIAQSLLAESLVDGVPERAGQAGRYRWHVTATPFRSEATQNGPGVTKITVVVENGETGRAVAVLSSLRLAR